MSNIRTVCATGSNGHLGTAFFSAGSGTATGNTIHHPAPHTAKAEDSHHDSGYSGSATGTGPIAKLPDTAPTNHSANHISNIYSPCRIPPG